MTIEFDRILKAHYVEKDMMRTRLDLYKMLFDLSLNNKFTSTHTVVEVVKIIKAYKKNYKELPDHIHNFLYMNFKDNLQFTLFREGE